jgi:hypothetical protein
MAEQKNNRLDLIREAFNNSLTINNNLPKLFDGSLPMPTNLTAREWGPGGRWVGNPEVYWAAQIELASVNGSGIISGFDYSVKLPGIEKTDWDNRSDIEKRNAWHQALGIR